MKEQYLIFFNANSLQHQYKNYGVIQKYELHDGIYFICFRTSKGRKTSLPIYNDDDNDLSDLGLSKGNDIPNNDDVFQEKQNVSCFIVLSFYVLTSVVLYCNVFIVVVVVFNIVLYVVVLYVGVL